MTRGASICVCLLALSAYVACQEESARAPSLPPCSGPGCVPPGSAPPPGSSQGGRDGDGGESGSGGEGGEGAEGGADSGTEISGTVREFVDIATRNSIVYTGVATISAEDVDGDVVTTRWNGSGRFELSRVAGSTLAWIHVQPLQNTSVLSTLQPVDLPRDDDLGLGLVRADELDLVFALLTVPSAPQPRRAQLVLSFTGPVGRGPSDITVSLPDAEFISYAAQGTWSELASATDSTGLVVLGNIAAPSFPGVTKRVRLSGSRQGVVDVRVAADAVSLVEVPAP